MALDAYSVLTLNELAKRHDPDGDTAEIAEVLAEENEILQDAIWDEANDVLSHQVTRRLSLPTGTHRKLNEGVPIEASRTINVREVVAMLESYSQCDKKLCQLAASPKQFRMNEAKSFLEGMAHTQAEAMLYDDNSLIPEGITGLAPRLDTLAASAYNVIGAGGTAPVTSIYVVMWGLSRLFMVYPRGSTTTGIQHTDLGEVTLEDAAGGLYQGYRDHFELNYGMVLKDDRAIGRICNIKTTGVDYLFDEDDLIKLINRMPNGPKWIYMNGTIATQVQIRLKDKNNVHWTPADGLTGNPVARIMGHPVRKVDQILNTEDAVA